MIYWEDDTSFVVILELLQKAFVWFESPEYRVLFGTMIYEIKDEAFY